MKSLFIKALSLLLLFSIITTQTSCTKEKAEALKTADEVGYPVMLKAAAGGGGKGMRAVHSAAEMKAAFETATAEAQAAFGDAALYIEKLIVKPRHIEIQIVADQHGNIIHLGRSAGDEGRRTAGENHVHR